MIQVLDAVCITVHFFFEIPPGDHNLECLFFFILAVLYTQKVLQAAVRHYGRLPTNLLQMKPFSVFTAKWDQGWSPHTLFQMQA